MVAGAALEDTTLAHPCARSGLHLLAAPRQGLWRVARNEYGATTPLVRTGPEGASWCRYDLAGRGTLYASSSRAGAYAECLAPLRPALEAIPFHELFDDLGPGDDPVTDEFLERGHQRPGMIARQWRADRCIAHVRVHEGWCVDVNHVASLATLRAALGAELAGLGCRDMDGGVIRSEDRAVTLRIAAWIAAQTLDDGSEPLGIKFRSRLNDDWDCWAIWSGPGGTVPASELHREPIELSDPALREIGALWGLWFF